MSDLCYNCGDCHLPRPCTVPLKWCEICANLGHTYNFCPLSVRRKDPSYQFWALCHNCDKWHLPNPCEIALHRCNGCGNGGHKEFFCPIKPLPRDLPSGQSVGIKRQRTSGSDVSDASQVAPEMVQKIKNEAATNIFTMLNRGYNHEEIMRQFAPNMVLMGAADPALGMVARNGSIPNTPTPAPTQTYSSRTEGTGTPGLYATMQDRFERGDLKYPTHRDSAQYADNPQSRNDTPTQNLGHHSGSHYAESFRSKHGNVQGSGDNLNVGAATGLQEIAESAVTGAVSTDPTASMVATAGSSVLGPLSQAQSFGDHLEHAIATSVGGFNAGTPTLASPMLHQGYSTINVSAGENMPGYQTHTILPQAAEDSIAVGTTEPEEPQLALRKDGKPRKRQPTRNQPPRKKVA